MTSLPQTLEYRARNGNRFARVLPLAFVTYSLAYLDRVNYGFGAAGGMAKTLGITPQMNARLAAAFFVGYFLFQIPATRYAARRSVTWIIFWSLLCWGILSSLTGMIRSIPLLYLDRFLLGAVEGVVFPGMLVYLTHWFTRPERSRANALLILGNPVTVLWASVVSGYLIQWFGWQRMFIIEGLPSVIWAFVWLWLAPERPADAHWLSPEAATTVQAELDEEQGDKSLPTNYAAAFRDRGVWLLCVQFFFWSAGIYGFVLWLPKIVKEASGLAIGLTGVVSAVPYLLGIIAMLSISYVSDRTLRRKQYVWPWLLAAAGGFLIAAIAGAGPFWLLFAGLVMAGASMYAPYGPYWALVRELVPQGVAGESMALINSIGAAGGYLGTDLVGRLSAGSSNPSRAMAFSAGCLALSGLLTLIVRREHR